MNTPNSHTWINRDAENFEAAVDYILETKDPSLPKQNFYALEKTGNNETTVTLYDEIGAFGAGSKQFLTDIGKLSGQHIHLRINSPGGSVVEGTAIYNALRRHEGGLTVHIDAMAASMASVIAMAGEPVYMADNALLMIHNPWTVSMGESKDLRKEADLLDKLKVNLRNAYVRKTGINAEEIGAMMDAETWLDAVEAVALGFADAIEEGVAAAATATPEMLRARFDTFAKASSSMNPTEVITYLAEDAEKAAEVIIATVVSESAPVEQPAPEPAPEVAAEAPAAEVPAEEIVEAPAAPAVEEPQAKLAAADAILAKFNALLVERDAAVAGLKEASAKIEFLRAEIAVERESLDRLERSFGLSAAREIPEVLPTQNAENIYDQWKNATGAEKTRIFRANRKALEIAAKNLTPQ
jgi:ATP-dependent protease ClpP protease subunit